MAEFNTWNHLQFNNNEGGLFLSYTNKNGAKVAAALRRIFPSQGVRFAQSIELIMAGPMEGSIVCQTPKVFSINCGELPSGKTADQDGIAGVWYAENGDIVLNAPNGGNVRLSPSASLRCENADQIKLYANETRIKGAGILNLEGNDEVEIAGGVKITERADIISGLKSLGSSRSPQEFIKNLLRFTG